MVARRGKSGPSAYLRTGVWGEVMLGVWSELPVCFVIRVLLSARGWKKVG